jgi:hypothetical protein
MSNRTVFLVVAVLAAFCMVSQAHSQSWSTAGKAYLVDVTTAWTNTGLWVDAGDTLLILGQGTFEIGPDNWTDAWNVWNAWGRGACGGSGVPVPEAPSSSLIAKIGDNPGFYIGGFRVFTADNSGDLYLGLNDNYFVDNSGTLVGIVFEVRDP